MRFLNYCMSIKKNYICVSPFVNLEVHDNSNHMCCPSWLVKSLPGDISLHESFNSESAIEIRESVTNGSFKYCDSGECPYLQRLETDRISEGPLFHKDKIPNEYFDIIENFKKGKKLSPQYVQFSMDQSCNLSCPSCRVELIMANSSKIKEVNLKIEEIENQFSESIKVLYITGSGDPFVSVAFRNFLRNFNPTKYPKLERIHLHTNATRWTKEMWESMPNIHPYVKTCEISIDAGTKETYETKTRIGGNWDTLIDNLKFISTIDTLKIIRTSFVVQKSNYKEMIIFRDMMVNIFGNRAHVYFGKILNWGHMTESKYIEEKVWDTSHPEYDNFIKILNDTVPHKNTRHNMYEFIYDYKSII